MTQELLEAFCTSKDQSQRRDLIRRSLDQEPHVRMIVPGYYNVYSYIYAGNAPTIAVTAHYDQANLLSDNCLDNNASVVNLINLHNRLLACRDLLKFNVIIAFIDGEETVDFVKCGISHLTHTHKFDQLIDFELTASGNNIAMCKYGDFNLFDYEEFRFPFNCAAVANYWEKQNPDQVQCYGSACLVLVDDDDLAQLRTHGFCARFAKCHSISDTIMLADIDEMDDFVTKIIKGLCY